MGLLLKAGAQAEFNIEELIRDFCGSNPSFHCVIFWINGDKEKTLNDIIDMSSKHGVICNYLPGKNCLALLPGHLDMELFSHRISNSTGSLVLFQFSANSFSIALNTLKPYLH